MPILQDVYNKLHDGEHITDEELALALNDFTILVDLLKDLGPVFKLPCKELRADLEAFKSIKDARDRKPNL